MASQTTQSFTADLDPIEVLVLDPHDASRIGLGVLLQREAWVSRCLVAADEQRAKVLASRHRPAVAAIDISQVGPFAGAVVASLREVRPGLQVVLTSHYSGAAIASPRQYGASAFVPADAPVADTIAALRAAAREEEVIHEVSVALPSTRGALSRRERDVLALLATGATNREIAAELYLGPDTVKKHASSLYRKLGVRNRTEATQQAVQLLAAG